MRWVWKIETPEPHTVELEVATVAARDLVRVDGRLAHDKGRTPTQNRIRIPLSLGTKPATLEIVSGFPLLPPSVRLSVDGHEVRPAVAPAGWGVFFAALCFVMIPLGGLLGGLLGGIGGVACLACASAVRWPALLRVSCCVVIVALDWAIYLAVADAITGK